MNEMNNDNVVLVKKQNPVSMVLVLMLVVSGFIIGGLYQKVSDNPVVTANANVGNNNAQPQPANVAGVANTAPVAPPVVNAGEIAQIREDDHVLGNRDASIVLIEYSDFDCPYCSRFHPTMKQVMAEYGDEVAWVYRHFPLAIHPDAQRKSEASECVAELGGNDAFWAFADGIFEGRGTDLNALASESGVDSAAFTNCLSSGKYTQDVKTEMAGGQQAGVTGTPGTLLVVDGEAQLLSGALPFASVKQVIDSKR